MKPNDPYYICPVCGCDKLEDPPYYEHFAGSNEICPCCGFEFGVDDFDCVEIDMKQLSDEEIIKQAHEIYRQNWINHQFKLFDPSKFRESEKSGKRLNVDVALKQLQRINCRT
ncbi:hypothetical protein AS033_06240 [Exiguobacterium indicum]|uniref:Uncharacterized protein n=2 Tax=Bacillales Family XII. Incertae Sedis TaxID=539742 RepID=A0A0V8GLJ4_9BACL|nr:hypothetical protein AS033_06240 [Exiguobacterium enclense]SDC18856.1 hypothetical protein SAMN05216342_1275 [Exiguobacterium enclense]